MAALPPVSRRPSRRRAWATAQIRLATSEAQTTTAAVGPTVWRLRVQGEIMARARIRQ